MRYAIVENGQITNVVEWDGQAPWAPSTKAEACPKEFGIGWTKDKQGFKAPPADLPSRTGPDPIAEAIARAKASQAGAG